MSVPIETSLRDLLSIRVDQDRLWESHVEIASIGALPKGGCRRLALSAEDGRGRDLFQNWCRDLGCEIRIDEIGNIFVRRSGTDGSRLPVSTGSHLDTQPNGGRFDGIYGVLAGLEVIRTLNDNRVVTEAPIELVVWTNEEGARFSPPLAGSQVFVGRLPLDVAHATETADGTRVIDDLKRIGYYGEKIDSKNHPLACFIECHIEQGPILEQEDRQIGVVTLIQGAIASSVTVKGIDGHAGTTPLMMRRDALLGAAKMVTRLNEIGRECDEAIRVTVGRFDVLPNSTSSIPSEVFFHIDLRHPDQSVLDSVNRRFQDEVASIASESNLRFEYKPMMEIEPTRFDETVVEVVKSAANQLGYSSRKMISGAGHDAMNLATVTPTGMIFVPCEKGISHSEAESAKPSDLAAGANVLLHSLLAYSGTVTRAQI